MDKQARVIKWNRDRGLLDKGFDPLLEMRMLSEEAREFYLADTFEQQLAEYADFLFVSYGSTAKYGANRPESVALFEVERKGYKILSEWMDEMIQEMHTVLESEYSMIKLRFKTHKHLDTLINFALEIVINCNERKGKITIDGKVQKDENHIDPKNIIKEYLCKLM